MSSKRKKSNTSVRLALLLLAMMVFTVIFYQQNKNGTGSIPITSESAEAEPAEVEENKEEQNLVADTGKESAIKDTSEKDVQKDVVIEVSPTPPIVETIRVEPDGAVVLAGRSDPNAEIKILLDEAVINSVQADASGNFVALFDIGASVKIRVMSLLAIVQSRETYAEEDIIIAASESTKTILADEKVVAKAETDVSDETMENQKVEHLSEEQSPKKTFMDIKIEEVAEVSEKKSDMQAEQKKDFAESETNTATSSGNQSLESTSLKTTFLEEKTKQPFEQTEHAAASSANIITTETETAGKANSKADETETKEQEKIVKSIEKEGNGETSKQEDKTPTVTTGYQTPVASASVSIAKEDDVFEMPFAEIETVGKASSNAYETETTEQQKFVILTEKEDNGDTSKQEDKTSTLTTEYETPVVGASVSAAEKDDVSEMPSAETETAGRANAKADETETTEQQKFVILTEKEDNRDISKQEDKTTTLTTEYETPVAGASVSAAEKDDVSEMPSAETETAGKANAKADETETTEQQKFVILTEKEDNGDISKQEDKTSTVTTEYETPVTGASVSAAEKDDVSEIPLAETVTLQTETDPESIATEKQAENEAPSVKKTVEENAEEERVEEELLVVIAGKDSVRVVQSSKKGTAQDVSVDAISYDETGDVALTGRGNPSKMVRIYLDNMPVSTAAMDATGQWSTALSEIDAGIYTLRVDELDSTGSVVSRLETPFKREKREDLAAYMLQADEPARINVVTVQPGNTLWAIARERYGQGILYVRVFEENKDKIRDPDLIYPGQVFSLPDD